MSKLYDSDDLSNLPQKLIQCSKDEEQVYKDKVKTSISLGVYLKYAVDRDDAITKNNNMTLKDWRNSNAYVLKRVKNGRPLQMGSMSNNQVPGMLKLPPWPILQAKEYDESETITPLSKTLTKYSEIKLGSIRADRMKYENKNEINESVNRFKRVGLTGSRSISTMKKWHEVYDPKDELGRSISSMTSLFSGKEWKDWSSQNHRIVHWTTRDKLSLRPKRRSISMGY